MPETEMKEVELKPVFKAGDTVYHRSGNGWSAKILDITQKKWSGCIQVRYKVQYYTKDGRARPKILGLFFPEDWTTDKDQCYKSIRSDIT